MKIYQTQSQLFKALMHPTRLAILDVLREGEQCVCHMEAMLELRQAHISQHLMILRDTGLVSDRRDGWNIFYRVSQPEVYTVIDAMNRFTDANADLTTNGAQFSTRKQSCPCPKCSAGLIFEKDLSTIEKKPSQGAG
jgi:DNA-binding transcriptional ArsR family regulator